MAGLSFPLEFRIGGLNTAKNELSSFIELAKRLGQGLGAEVANVPSASGAIGTSNLGAMTLTEEHLPQVAESVVGTAAGLATRDVAEGRTKSFDKAMVGHMGRLTEGVRESVREGVEKSVRRSMPDAPEKDINREINAQMARLMKGEHGFQGMLDQATSRFTDDATRAAQSMGAVTKETENLGRVMAATAQTVESLMALRSDARGSRAPTENQRGVAAALTQLPARVADAVRSVVGRQAPQTVPAPATAGAGTYRVVAPEQIAPGAQAQVLNPKGNVATTFTYREGQDPQKFLADAQKYAEQGQRRVNREAEKKGRALLPPPPPVSTPSGVVHPMWGSVSAPQQAGPMSPAEFVAQEIVKQGARSPADLRAKVGNAGTWLSGFFDAAGRPIGPAAGRVATGKKAQAQANALIEDTDWALATEWPKELARPVAQAWKTPPLDAAMEAAQRGEEKRQRDSRPVTPVGEMSPQEHDEYAAAARNAERVRAENERAEQRLKQREAERRSLERVEQVRQGYVAASSPDAPPIDVQGVLADLNREFQAGGARGRGLTVKELQGRLEELGAPTAGRKAELQERLLSATIDATLGDRELVPPTTPQLTQTRPDDFWVQSLGMVKDPEALARIRSRDPEQFSQATRAKREEYRRRAERADAERAAAEQRAKAERRGRLIGPETPAEAALLRAGGPDALHVGSLQFRDIGDGVLETSPHDGNVRYRATPFIDEDGNRQYRVNEVFDTFRDGEIVTEAVRRRDGGIGDMQTRTIIDPYTGLERLVPSTEPIPTGPVTFAERQRSSFRGVAATQAEAGELAARQVTAVADQLVVRADRDREAAAEADARARAAAATKLEKLPGAPLTPEEQAVIAGGERALTADVPLYSARDRVSIPVEEAPIPLLEKALQDAGGTLPARTVQGDSRTYVDRLHEAARDQGLKLVEDRVRGRVYKSDPFDNAPEATRPTMYTNAGARAINAMLAWSGQTDAMGRPVQVDPRELGALIPGWEVTSSGGGGAQFFRNKELAEKEIERRTTAHGIGDQSVKLEDAPVAALRRFARERGIRGRTRDDLVGALRAEGHRYVPVEGRERRRAARDLLERNLHRRLEEVVDLAGRDVPFRIEETAEELILQGPDGEIERGKISQARRERMENRAYTENLAAFAPEEMRGFIEETQRRLAAYDDPRRFFGRGNRGARRRSRRRRRRRSGPEFSPLGVEMDPEFFDWHGYNPASDLAQQKLEAGAGVSVHDIHAARSRRAQAERQAAAEEHYRRQAEQLSFERDPAIASMEEQLRREDLSPQDRESIGQRLNRRRQLLREEYVQQRTAYTREFPGVAPSRRDEQHLSDQRFMVRPTSRDLQNEGVFFETRSPDPDTGQRRYFSSPIVDGDIDAARRSAEGLAWEYVAERELRGQDLLVPDQMVAEERARRTSRREMFKRQFWVEQVGRATGADFDEVVRRARDAGDRRAPLEIQYEEAQRLTAEATAAGSPLFSSQKEAELNRELQSRYRTAGLTVPRDDEVIRGQLRDQRLAELGYSVAERDGRFIGLSREGRQIGDFETEELARRGLADFARADLRGDEIYGSRGVERVLEDGTVQTLESPREGLMDQLRRRQRERLQRERGGYRTVGERQAANWLGSARQRAARLLRGVFGGRRGYGPMGGEGILDFMERVDALEPSRPVEPERVLSLDPVDEFTRAMEETMASGSEVSMAQALANARADTRAAEATGLAYPTQEARLGPAEQQRPADGAVMDTHLARGIFARELAASDEFRGKLSPFSDVRGTPNPNYDPAAMPLFLEKLNAAVAAEQARAVEARSQRERMLDVATGGTPSREGTQWQAAAAQGLSERDAEILRLTQEGKTPEQIARDLALDQVREGVRSDAALGGPEAVRQVLEDLSFAAPLPGDPDREHQDALNRERQRLLQEATGRTPTTTEPGYRVLDPSAGQPTGDQERRNLERTAGSQAGPESTRDMQDLLPPPPITAPGRLFGTDVLKGFSKSDLRAMGRDLGIEMPPAPEAGQRDRVPQIDLIKAIQAGVEGPASTVAGRVTEIPPRILETMTPGEAQHIANRLVQEAAERSRQETLARHAGRDYSPHVTYKGRSGGRGKPKIYEPTNLTDLQRRAQSAGLDPGTIARGLELSGQDGAYRLHVPGALIDDDVVIEGPAGTFSRQASYGNIEDALAAAQQYTTTTDSIRTAREAAALEMMGLDPRTLAVQSALFSYYDKSRLGEVTAGAFDKSVAGTKTDLFTSRSRGTREHEASRVQTIAGDASLAAQHGLRYLQGREQARAQAEALGIPFDASVSDADVREAYLREISARASALYGSERPMAWPHDVPSATLEDFRKAGYAPYVQGSDGKLRATDLSSGEVPTHVRRLDEAGAPTGRATTFTGGMQAGILARVAAEHTFETGELIDFVPQAQQDKEASQRRGEAPHAGVTRARQELEESRQRARRGPEIADEVDPRRVPPPPGYEAPPPSPPPVVEPPSRTTSRIENPQWMGVHSRSRIEEAQRHAAEQLVIRAPADVAGQIIEQGFKTQFETGQTRGGNTAAQRRKTEAFWGIPEDAPASERPVYGFVEDAEALRRTAGYGDVLFRVKPDPGQTTLTLGDSGMDVPPDIVGLEDFSKAEIDDLARFSTAKEDYIEAQFHGGLRPDQIESVDYIPRRFTERMFHGLQQAAQAAHELGVPLNVALQPSDFLEQARGDQARLQGAVDVLREKGYNIGLSSLEEAAGRFGVNLQSVHEVLSGPGAENVAKSFEAEAQKVPEEVEKFRDQVKDLPPVTHTVGGAGGGKPPVPPPTPAAPPPDDWGPLWSDRELAAARGRFGRFWQTGTTEKPPLVDRLAAQLERTAKSRPHRDLSGERVGLAESLKGSNTPVLITGEGDGKVRIERPVDTAKGRVWEQEWVPAREVVEVPEGSAGKWKSPFHDDPDPDNDLVKTVTPDDLRAVLSDMADPRSKRYPETSSRKYWNRAERALRDVEARGGTPEVAQPDGTLKPLQATDVDEIAKRARYAVQDVWDVDKGAAPKGSRKEAFAALGLSGTDEEMRAARKAFNAAWAEEVGRQKEGVSGPAQAAVVGKPAGGAPPPTEPPLKPPTGARRPLPERSDTVPPGYTDIRYNQQTGKFEPVGAKPSAYEYDDGVMRWATREYVPETVDAGANKGVREAARRRNEQRFREVQAYADERARQQEQVRREPVPEVTHAVRGPDGQPLLDAKGQPVVRKTHAKDPVFLASPEGQQYTAETQSTKRLSVMEERNRMLDQLYSMDERYNAALRRSLQLTQRLATTKEQMIAEDPGIIEDKAEQKKARQSTKNQVDELLFGDDEYAGERFLDRQLRDVDKFRREGRFDEAQELEALIASGVDPEEYLQSLSAMKRQMAEEEIPDRALAAEDRRRGTLVAKGARAREELMAEPGSPAAVAMEREAQAQAAIEARRAAVRERTDAVLQDQYGAGRGGRGGGGGRRRGGGMFHGMGKDWEEIRGQLHPGELMRNAVSMSTWMLPMSMTFGLIQFLREVLQTTLEIEKAFRKTQDQFQLAYGGQAQQHLKTFQDRVQQISASMNIPQVELNEVGRSIWASIGPGSGQTFSDSILPGGRTFSGAELADRQLDAVAKFSYVTGRELERVNDEFQSIGINFGIDAGAAADLLIAAERAYGVKPDTLSQGVADSSTVAAASGFRPEEYVALIAETERRAGSRSAVAVAESLNRALTDVPRKYNELLKLRETIPELQDPEFSRALATGDTAGVLTAVANVAAEVKDEQDVRNDPLWRKGTQDLILTTLGSERNDKDFWAALQALSDIMSGEDTRFESMMSASSGGLEARYENTQASLRGQIDSLVATITNVAVQISRTGLIEVLAEVVNVFSTLVSSVGSVVKLFDHLDDVANGGLTALMQWATVTKMLQFAFMGPLNSQGVRSGGLLDMGAGLRNRILGREAANVAAREAAGAAVGSGLADGVPAAAAAAGSRRLRTRGRNLLRGLFSRGGAAGGATAGATEGAAAAAAGGSRLLAGAAAPLAAVAGVLVADMQVDNFRASQAQAEDEMFRRFMDMSPEQLRVLQNREMGAMQYLREADWAGGRESFDSLRHRAIIAQRNKATVERFRSAVEAVGETGPQDFMSFFDIGEDEAVANIFPGETPENKAFWKQALGIIPFVEIGERGAENIVDKKEDGRYVLGSSRGQVKEWRDRILETIRTENPAANEGEQADMANAAIRMLLQGDFEGITTGVEEGDAGALGALRLMEREAEHDSEMREALVQTEFQDDLARWSKSEAVPLDRLITQYTTGDSTAGQIISSIQEKRAQLDEMQRAAESKGATHAEIAELQIEYEKKLMQFWGQVVKRNQQTVRLMSQAFGGGDAMQLSQLAIDQAVANVNDPRLSTEERQAAGDQLIQELMNKYQAYVRGDDYTFNNAESRYIRAVRGMRVAEEERAAVRSHQASIVLDSEPTGAFLDSFKTRDDAIKAIATQMDKGLIGGDLRIWMKEETIRRSKQVEQERKRELQEVAAGPLDRSWNRIIDRAGEMAREPRIGERITPTTEGEDRGSRFPRIGDPGSLGQGMRPDAPGGTYVWNGSNFVPVVRREGMAARVTLDEAIEEGWWTSPFLPQTAERLAEDAQRAALEGAGMAGIRAPQDDARVWVRDQSGEPESGRYRREWRWSDDRNAWVRMPQSGQRMRGSGGAEYRFDGESGEFVIIDTDKISEVNPATLNLRQWDVTAPTMSAAEMHVLGEGGQVLPPPGERAPSDRPLRPYQRREDSRRQQLEIDIWEAAARRAEAEAMGADTTAYDRQIEAIGDMDVVINKETVKQALAELWQQNMQLIRLEGMNARAAESQYDFATAGRNAGTMGREISRLRSDLPDYDKLITELSKRDEFGNVRDPIALQNTINERRQKEAEIATKERDLRIFEHNLRKMQTTDVQVAQTAIDVAMYGSNLRTMPLERQALVASQRQAASTAALYDSLGMPMEAQQARLQEMAFRRDEIMKRREQAHYARNLQRAEGAQRGEVRQQLRFAEDGRNTRTMFQELVGLGRSVQDADAQVDFHRFMGEDLEAAQAYNQWLQKRAERAQKIKEFAEFQRQLYRARATDRRSAIIDVARALGGESTAILQEEIDHLAASERELRRDAEAYRREGDELRYEQTMNEVAAIIAQRANKQRELRNFLREHAAAQSNLTMSIVSHSRDIVAIAQAEYREAARVLNDMLLHPEDFTEADVLNQRAELQLRRTGLRDALYTDAMADIDYRREMQEITTGQAIRELEGWAAYFADNEAITREINLKIKQLKDSSEMQFNLPEELRLGTFYMARRLRQQADYVLGEDAVGGSSELGRWDQGGGWTSAGDWSRLTDVPQIEKDIPRLADAEKIRNEMQNALGGDTAKLSDSMGSLREAVLALRDVFVGRPAAEEAARGAAATDRYLGYDPNQRVSREEAAKRLGTWKPGQAYLQDMPYWRDVVDNHYRQSSAGYSPDELISRQQAAMRMGTHSPERSYLQDMVRWGDMVNQHASTQLMSASSSSKVVNDNRQVQVLIHNGMGVNEILDVLSEALGSHRVGDDPRRY